MNLLLSSSKELNAHPFFLIRDSDTDYLAHLAPDLVYESLTINDRTFAVFEFRNPSEETLVRLACEEHSFESMKPDIKAVGQANAQTIIQNSILGRFSKFLQRQTKWPKALKIALFLPFALVMLPVMIFRALFVAKSMIR